MNPWWTGIPAAEATVACNGSAHTLRWEQGRLETVDHGDPEAEATLAALAGEPLACLHLLSAWNRRRDDPRVLMLASRGPLDPLDAASDGPQRGAQQLAVGGARPRPIAPAPTTASRGGEMELLELLALDGGLLDRLQAHTAATWTRRLRTGHAALDATLPQLHAALYGRILAAIRLWLGEPNLLIELTMVDPAADRTLARTDETIAIALPFEWLTNVWARGLTTIFGRLCLQADTEDGTHWTLDTIGTDLHDRARVVVSLVDTTV